GKAAGGGATAKSSPLGAATSGVPGADLAGGATDGGSKVDPLANPNLVSLAIDGWFTIYKKPKPEVLARVYPAPATDPGSTAPADTGVTAQNGAGANGNSSSPAGTAAGGAGPNPGDSATQPADTPAETVADGSESNPTETPPAADTTLAAPTDGSKPAAGEAPAESTGDTPGETPSAGTTPAPTDSAAPK
ncbi:MAG: hypothetical protein NT069_13220, partial [Planctomycetota bacterium]|nr:hypothetical protein [Planctomycetota bacterium]